MTDIVERLRSWSADKIKSAAQIERDEAADEIVRLRSALREIADDGIYLRNGASWHDTGKMKNGIQAFARKALKENY